MTNEQLIYDSNELVGSTKKFIEIVVITTCEKRWLYECTTINRFIAKGITMKQIVGALKNKFGTSPKTMWLVDYSAIKMRSIENAANANTVTS